MDDPSELSEQTIQPETRRVYQTPVLTVESADAQTRSIKIGIIEFTFVGGSAS